MYMHTLNIVPPTSQLTFNLFVRVKSDGFYVKNLHHIRAEFEEGVTDSKRPLTIRHSESEFPGFSGHGYVPALNQQVDRCERQ